MSSRSGNKKANKNPVVTGNDSNGTIPGAAAKMGEDESYVKAKETLFQSTPEASAFRRIIRAGLLWMYFWTCVVMYVLNTSKSNIPPED